MARRDRKKRTRKDPDASRRRAGGRVTVSNRPGAWKKALLDRDAPNPELRLSQVCLRLYVGKFYDKRPPHEPLIREWAAKQCVGAGPSRSLVSPTSSAQCVTPPVRRRTETTQSSRP